MSDTSTLARYEVVINGRPTILKLTEKGARAYPGARKVSDGPRARATSAEMAVRERTSPRTKAQKKATANTPKRDAARSERDPKRPAKKAAATARREAANKAVTTTPAVSSVAGDGASGD